MKAMFLGMVAFCFLSGFTACKKKKDTAGPSDDQYATTPIGPSNCYGEIYFEESYSMNSGFYYETKSPLQAFFYDLPMTNAKKRSLDVGTVTVNGTVLKTSGGVTTQKVYGDSTKKLISLQSFTLNASGQNQVAGFNFEYSSGSPVLGDTNLIPSVVSRSSGIDITFREISNADSLVLFLSRDFSNTITKQVLTYGASQATVKISASEIANLMMNNADAVISVVVFRKTFVRAGDRDYLVHSRKSYYKNVLVSFF